MSENQGSFTPRPIRDLDDLLTRAWGLIANVAEGDWAKETLVWRMAAEWWRDQYFKYLRDQNSSV